MTLAANHWCNPSYVACIKAAHASEDSDGIMDLGRQEGLVVLKTITITIIYHYHYHEHFVDDGEKQNQNQNTKITKKETEGNN